MAFSREIVSEDDLPTFKSIDQIRVPRNIQVQTIAEPYLGTIGNFDIVLKNTNGILPPENQTLLEHSIKIFKNEGLSYEEILLIVFKEQSLLKKYLREQPEFNSIKTSLLDYSFIENQARQKEFSKDEELFPPVFRAMVDSDTKNSIYQNTQYSRRIFQKIISNPNFWLYTIKLSESTEENQKKLLKYLPKTIRDKMFDNYLQRYKEESNEIPICVRDISSIFHIHHSRVSELLNKYHINRTRKIFREKEFISSDEPPFLEEIWEMMKDRKTKGEIKKTLGCYIKNLEKIFSSLQFEEYITNLPEETGIDKNDLLFIYLGKTRKLEILNQYLAKLKENNPDQIIDITKLAANFHLDFYKVRKILKDNEFNVLEHPIKNKIITATCLANLL